MAGTFKFELVSPERVLMSADAEQAMLPALEGDMTVFPSHAPVVITLRPGVLDISMVGSKSRIFVHSGFAEILPDRVTVLAEKAFDMADIDAAYIAAELKAAEEQLAAAVDDDAVFMASRAVEQLRLLGGKAA
ncbi:MAG: ATP synthase F1 subunit epsilon [Hyphomicrobium sp.]